MSDEAYARICVCVSLTYNKVADKWMDFFGCVSTYLGRHFFLHLIFFSFFTSLKGTFEKVAEQLEKSPSLLGRHDEYATRKNKMTCGKREKVNK